MEQLATTGQIESPRRIRPRWLRWLRRQSAAASSEQPLREELFSLEQLRQHAMALAASHQIDGGGRHRLLARLAENERVLRESYSTVTHGGVDRRFEPAAEWLVDNFHLIEEQIRTARRHLPREYSHELPRLKSGPSAGNPRVYDLALSLIAHVDGLVDIESLTAFVSTYQSVVPLKLGELWAIPIMLRLALIENLRRVAVRIAADRSDRNEADRWANQLIETAQNDPRRLVMVVAEMAEANPPLSNAFVAELSRRLHSQTSSLAMPLSWIEQCLAETGLSIEQVVHWESQQQAADQVSIGNSINSLRFLSATDWREFVETQSVVERTLLDDPAGIYAQCDFATRDRCRHAVEKLAKRSPHTENHVALQAIELARAG